MKGMELRTRNLPEENTAQEPNYEEETVTEGHRTTDRDKENEKWYPLEEVSWENIEQNEGQNRVLEDSTMGQREAAIMKRKRGEQTQRE